ncbi:hypothetical protein ABZ614_18905 [Streptomyces sp. NPDC013178]
MPHILTHILTQAAIAVVEAALIRLSFQLWKALTAGGRPATVHA